MASAKRPRISGGPDGVGVSSGDPDSELHCFAKVGIPWTAPEFFKASKEISVHPLDAFNATPDDIKLAVDRILLLGPDGVAEMRERELLRWASLKESLADKEIELHNNLQDGPSRILKDANKRLFRELLLEINYPDKNLVHDLVIGMPIVGEIPNSSVFPKVDPIVNKNCKPVEQLWRESKSSRRKMLDSLRPGDPEFDQAILKGSQKEFFKGTMGDPYSEQEAISRFGPLFLPARRFCIQQGVEVTTSPTGEVSETPKFRLVDDFSEYGHNQVACVHETISTDGVDSIAGVCKSWFRAFSPLPKFPPPIATGDQQRTAAAAAAATSAPIYTYTYADQARPGQTRPDQTRAAAFRDASLEHDVCRGAPAAFPDASLEHDVCRGAPVPVWESGTGAAVHESWTTDGLSLVGYLQDMKAAYRQLPRRESQKSMFLIAYWDCERSCPVVAEHFGQPFGAKAAVVNFNRLARALRAILVAFLFFALTQYFDDFTIVEPSQIAAQGKVFFDRAVKILGWSFECKVDPSHLFVSLGVPFDVSRVLPFGSLVLSNTDRRVANILFELNSILKGGALSPARAASLRGKLGFAFSQVFGRAGRAGLRLLTERQYSHSRDSSLSKPMLMSFEFWKAFLKCAVPRTLDFKLESCPPLLVFTNGWQSENSSSAELGVGAVLFDPIDRAILYFGCLLSDEIVDLWSGSGEKSMLIHQAELFPVLLARTTWSDRFWRRRNISFIDNDGARDSLIKGYSPVLHSGHIIGVVSFCENRLQTLSWFTRVPSEGNISDGPSRLDFTEVRALGGVSCEVQFPSNWAPGCVPSHEIRWRWSVPGDSATTR